jgi:hypothetical protein
MEFRTKFEFEDGLINYIWGQWLCTNRQQFVKCYTDQYLHFGNVTTSRLEGMHYVLKRRLHSSQGDLAEVVRQFKTLQRHHLVKIAHSEGMSKICTGPEFTGPLWALIRGHISQFALTRVR